MNFIASNRNLIKYKSNLFDNIIKCDGETLEYSIDVGYKHFSISNLMTKINFKIQFENDNTFYENIGDILFNFVFPCGYASKKFNFSLENEIKTNGFYINKSDEDIKLYIEKIKFLKINIYIENQHTSLNVKLQYFLFSLFSFFKCNSIFVSSRKKKSFSKDYNFDYTKICTYKAFDMYIKSNKQIYDFLFAGWMFFVIDFNKKIVSYGTFEIQKPKLADYIDTRLICSPN